MSAKYIILAPFFHLRECTLKHFLIANLTFLISFVAPLCCLLVFLDLTYFAAAVRPAGYASTFDDILSWTLSFPTATAFQVCAHRLVAPNTWGDDVLSVRHAGPQRNERIKHQGSYCEHLRINFKSSLQMAMQVANQFEVAIAKIADQFEITIASRESNQFISPFRNPNTHRRFVLSRA